MSGAGHPRIAPRTLVYFLWRALLPTLGANRWAPSSLACSCLCLSQVCEDAAVGQCPLVADLVWSRRCKKPLQGGQPEDSWKIQCFTCPELILARFGRPKMDKEGGRRELQASAYPVCVRAACEHPGPRRNPSSHESHHCTVHWSHVQFNGTLILWHLKAFWRSVWLWIIHLPCNNI